MAERATVQRAIAPPAPAISLAAPGKGLLQRKCKCGESAGAGDKCGECKKKEGLLQRRQALAIPSIVHEVLRPGQPLEAATRAIFEPRFAHDFSKVRVRANASGSESALASNGEDPSVVALPWQTHTILRTADKSPNPPGPTASPAPPRSSPSAPPTSEQPAPRRHACVTSEKIPDKQTGVMPQQGQVNDYFEMNIDWSNSGPGCDCKCGEYRQFVKGYMKVNGRKKDKPLAGGAILEENTYHEDGDASPYGHRDLPESSNDKFITPGRATGCSYRGKDTPGLAAVPGVHLDMSLTFKGQTYDSCTGTFGKINEWKVAFNGLLP